MLRQIVLIMAVVSSCLSGCEPTRPAATNPNNPSGNNLKVPQGQDQPIAVVLQLNWRPEAEHGGYYAALVHGIYAEEGLDVTIKPGGPEINVSSNVAIGGAAFGVDNADKLLRARAEEADVVSVFAPIQDSPRCLMVHEESGIKKLEDLQTVPGITLSWNPIQPFALFLKQKLDLSQVQMTRYAGSVGPFLLDKKHVQQAYNISEPYLARKEGAHPVNLMLSEAGFNPYTSILLTNRQMLNERSNVVWKMVRASQRGWQKYLTDATESNHHIAKLNPEMPTDVLDFGVKELQSLCLPDHMQDSGIGTMNAARWETLVKQLEEIEVLQPGAVDPSSAYTTEFMPQPK